MSERVAKQPRPLKRGHGDYSSLVEGVYEGPMVKEDRSARRRKSHHGSFKHLIQEQPQIVVATPSTSNSTTHAKETGELRKRTVSTNTSVNTEVNSESNRPQQVEDPANSWCRCFGNIALGLLSIFLSYFITAVLIHNYRYSK